MVSSLLSQNGTEKSHIPHLECGWFRCYAYLFIARILLRLQTVIKYPFPELVDQNLFDLFWSSGSWW